MTNGESHREAIRARLAEIEERNGGRLTPRDVVADARDPDSPLHSCFEWDTERAADAYRIEQARSLITSVRLVVRTETRAIKTVYYVRDPEAANREQGYVSVERLRTDKDRAREALLTEFGQIADRLRRGREIAVVLGLSHEIEALLHDVVGLRQRVVEEPAQAH